MLGWEWFFRCHAADAADRLASGPSVGPVVRWVWGLGLAAALAAGGLWSIVTGSALFPVGYDSVWVYGRNAVAIGLFWLSLGALLHFHFLWAPHPRLWRAGHVGKVLALLAFLGSLGYVTVRVVLWGP